MYSGGGLIAIYKKISSSSLLLSCSYEFAHYSVSVRALASMHGWWLLWRCTSAEWPVFNPAVTDLHPNKLLHGLPIDREELSQTTTPHACSFWPARRLSCAHERNLDFIYWNCITVLSYSAAFFMWQFKRLKSDYLL